MSSNLASASTADMQPTSLRRLATAIGFMTGPSVIGAALSFLTTPLLIHWFTPAQFGDTANALAIASILSGIVTLRLEVLIYRPAHVEYRAEIARAALWMTVVAASILLVVLVPVDLLFEQRRGWAEIVYVLMVWLMTIALGVTNLGTAYQVSRGGFLRSGLPKLLTPVLVLIVAGGAAAMGMRTATTLLAANVAGLVGTALLYCREPLRDAKGPLPSGVRGLLHAERSYIAFAVPQSAVYAASFLNLFMLLATSCYGAAVAGQLFLAFRLVGFPSTILGTATGNLLSSKSDEIKVHGFRRYLIGMGGAGILIYLPLGLLLSLIPVHIVPTQWRGALYVLSPILVLCFAQFVFGSFGQLMLIWNRAGRYLAWDAARLVLTCGAGMLVWALGGSYVLATWTFVIVQVAAFLSLAGLLSATARDRPISKKEQVRMADPLGRDRAKMPALDGFRGLAASWVVIHHLSTNHLVPGTPLLLNGWMLVDAFFVISGFVMAYQYTNRLKTLEEVGGFLWRRLARIWPLHVSILLLMFLPRLAQLVLHGAAGSQLLTAGSDHSIGSLIASLLLVHGMGPYSYAVWNGPSWTISVEFFAYIVFALLSVQNRLLYRWGVALFVITSGFELIASGVYLATPLPLSFPRCVFGFLIGCLSLMASRRWHDHLSAFPWVDAAELLVFSVMLAFIAFAAHGPLSILFPPVCAVIVILLANGRGIVSRIMTTRVAQALGAWSLGIYLIHIPLLNIVIGIGHHSARLGLDFTRAAWAWPETVLFCALVLLLSAAAHVWIEKPARRWLTRGMGGRAGPTEPAGRRNLQTRAAE